MARSTLTIILGVLLTVAIAAFLWNGLYAGIVFLRAGDKSVFVQLLGEDLLASVRHAWPRRLQSDTLVNAGVAAAFALLGAGVLPPVAIPRRDSPLGGASLIQSTEGRGPG